MRSAYASPAIALKTFLVNTQLYAVPPVAQQKPGDFPLGQCLEDDTISTPAGVGCWRFFVARGGPFAEHETELPSNDSRMQQVFYANGKLWSALDTDVNVGGQDVAGVAWFVLNPNAKGKAVAQGILAWPSGDFWPWSTRSDCAKSSRRCSTRTNS